jgi:hypothetical protein
MADMRTGLPEAPTSVTVATPRPFLFSGTMHPAIVEVVGTGAATKEFLDRWRLPGGVSHVREERFASTRTCRSRDRINDRSRPV